MIGTPGTPATPAAPRPWITLGRSTLIAGLAVVIGVLAVPLALWPALGIPALATAAILAVVGIHAARAGRRRLRDAGQSEWKAWAAYAVHALAALLVSVSLVAGSAICSLGVAARSLAPRPATVHAPRGEDVPELLAAVGITGGLWALWALDRREASGAVDRRDARLETSDAGSFPAVQVFLVALGAIGFGEYVTGQRTAHYLL